MKLKWKVKHSESKDAFNVIGDIPGGKYKIAQCPYSVSDDAEVTKINKDEAEAHAHLIAAAPDMLEALQSIVEDVDHILNAGDIKLTKALRFTAKAAINKATNKN